MAKMTRRRFVAATATAGLAAPFLQGEEARSMGKKQPNVLLIHVDQHRIDCLGAYGNKEIQTPHIDALAKDGVRYDNSFCPFPVCTPSRYSLMSSQWVFQHRGCSNHCTLPPGTATFPQILKDAGYKTKAIGKMHFTPTYADVGFSEMELSEQNGPGRWDDDYHRELREADLAPLNDLEDQEREYRDHARDIYWDTFGALPTNLPSEYHSTEWISRRALDTVNGWSDSGNFLMLGFVKPHHPFDPPQEWVERYDPDRLSLPPDWTDRPLAHDWELSQGYFKYDRLNEASLRRVKAYYYATISHIDHQVGKLIDALKARGMYDDTLIIYTSDHGEYLGCHHMLLKGNYMYDPVVKVPLIIKYPGNERADTASDGFANTIDVGPTILAQAGCAPAPAMAGVNLAEADEPRPVTFAESHNCKQVMARTKTRKLILYPERDGAFLYDLEKDPYELNNVYDTEEYREDVAQLTKAIDDWRGVEAVVDFHLDESAPRIDQPNVPPLDDGHRKPLQEYFWKKMGETLELPESPY